MPSRYIREWLSRHPKVLALVFTLAVATGEVAAETATLDGSGSSTNILGP